MTSRLLEWVSLSWTRWPPKLPASRVGVLTPDPEPEKGFYYRSDHFSFAKVGIPAFYADPGVEYIGKLEGYGIEKREQYTAEDLSRALGRGEG